MSDVVAKPCECCKSHGTKQKVVEEDGREAEKSVVHELVEIRGKKGMALVCPSCDGGALNLAQRDS
jgi:hypothetical protein